MEIGEENLVVCVDEKIREGKRLVERLKIINDKVEGVDKLMRKINQEIRFLAKVQSSGIAKKEYLQSTNLIHLKAMVERLLVSDGAICVMRPFKDEQNERLDIDIVCESGATWIKVVARNARALTLVSLGNGEYGQKSILDQAKAYKRCASFHPHRYREPKILFHFACGVESTLARRLQRLGIVVEGKIMTSDENDKSTIGVGDESMKIPNDPRVVAKSNEEFIDDGVEQRSTSTKFRALSSKNVCSKDIDILNLDVSTLLAYVSNMTNGHANFVYREPLLSGQAECERKRPLKLFLDALFEDKELLVCKTAYKNFFDIVATIGGPCETTRANELAERIRIVDDAKDGRMIERLCVGGKIKKRSLLVFATGESTKSITVSANEGFVRAARMQGIECTVVLHEPRSLSEMKEKHATPVKKS